MKKISIDPIQVLTTVAIIISMFIGYFFNQFDAVASLIWPAAGFSTALVYLYRKRVFSVVILTIFIVNIINRMLYVEEQFLQTILISVTIVIVNACTIGLFLFLADHIKVDMSHLNKPKPALAFTLIAFLTAFGAGFLASLFLGVFYGYDAFIKLLLDWALGDMLGILVFGGITFLSHYADKPISFYRWKQTIPYTAIFIIITFFAFSNVMDGILDEEFFEMTLIVLYITAVYLFSYRIILFNGLIILSMAHILYLINFVTANDLFTRQMTIVMFVVILSVIATVLKNTMLDRERSYYELEKANESLETMILSINNMFNIQNRLPEENKEFSMRYLKNMFELACRMNPDFSYASCFVKDDQGVQFIGTKGYDMDLLNQMDFDATTFFVDLFEPKIFKEELMGYSIPNTNQREIYVAHVPQIKESLRFSVQIGDDVFGSISFDIVKDESKSFTNHDLESFKSFQNVVNSYYSVGIQTSRNTSFKDDIVQSLVQALEMYDSYTGSHSVEVASMSVTIGKRLRLSEEQIRILFWSSLVHDIGKIGIDSVILNKAGRLTDDEYKLIKDHPRIGYNILQQSSGLKQIAKVVLHHHEKYDGSGYPDGLKGEEIPFLSQIIHVCDAVSAMSINRVYKTALSEADIIDELIRYSGTQFHPDIIKLMVVFIQNGELNNVLRSR